MNIPSEHSWHIHSMTVEIFHPKAPAIFYFITCLLSCFNLCNIFIAYSYAIDGVDVLIGFTSSTSFFSRNSKYHLSFSLSLTFSISCSFLLSLVLYLPSTLNTLFVQYITFIYYLLYYI